MAEIRVALKKRYLARTALERMTLLIPVSVGELIDKITIWRQNNTLMIHKTRNINQELSALMAVVVEQGLGYPNGELADQGHQLASVNLQLWEIEDEIRECERQACFDARFIALARSVYKRNDERARIKRLINAACGSAFVEEKSYSRTNLLVPYLKGVPVSGISHMAAVGPDVYQLRLVCLVTFKGQTGSMDQL